MMIQNRHKKYNTCRNLIYSCQYHVIFSPKFRRKVLSNPIQKRLKQIFLEVSDSFGFEIIEQEIMEDHVHLLVSVNPNFGVSKAVAKLKATSSRVLRKEFPELRKKLPCLWTNSKFVSSVGSVSLDVVKKYIEDQKNV